MAPAYVEALWGKGPGAGTDRTINVMQDISDGSHAQVSIHHNLDPRGRLVVMEFVTTRLEGQKTILPAGTRRMVRHGSRVFPKRNS